MKIKIKDLMSTYGEYTISDELIEKLEPPEATTVWDLPNGDTYYYTDIDGAIMFNAWYESCKGERDMGNVFLTQEDAERDVERRKVETLLLKYGGRRWFKKSGENWILRLDKHNQATRFEVGEPYQGFIYFDSYEEAVNACEQIGNKRIVKVLFEVR